MQMFVIINNAGMMINARVNVKNWLIKAYAIKDSFGIRVTASVNVINHAILVSIETMKVVSVGKNYLINLLKNVLKILMK